MIRVALAALVALGLCSVARADPFLDFDALPASTNIGGAPNNAASILTTQFSNLGIVFGQPGVSTGVAVVTYQSESFSDPNFISGLDAAGEITFAVAGDMYFRFVSPGTLIPSTTSSVSFVIGDSGGDSDSWMIRAFDLGGSVIDTQNLSGDSYQNYSVSVAGIHRIQITNTTGTAAGYAVDNLGFATPASVPEPAVGLLCVVGFGLLAWRRRLRERGNTTR